MRSNWLVVVGLAAISGGWLYTRTSAQSAAGSSPQAEVGRPAPDFELKDTYGKTFTLKEFKDHIVVLEWFNPGCPFVKGRHGDQTMQKTYARYAGKGVIWLAIDSTAGAKPDKNRVYAAEQHLAYPVLMDADGRVARAYGAKTTPHMLVIDRSGKLAYTGAIDDDPGGQKDKKEVANYVAAALDDLLADKAVAKSRTQPYGCSIKMAQ
ncbi:MAG TPA: redoxin domain-containing protein [Phycisphaerae bacterium]|nr:redoxin domain-containing protein [Phycisphaerae bacterium]